jgi:hypothetical protein
VSIAASIGAAKLSMTYWSENSEGIIILAFLSNQIVLHIVKMLGLSEFEQLPTQKTVRDQTP